MTLNRNARKFKTFIALFVVASMIFVALALTGCMNIPLPSKPKISLSPAAPVAGQRVVISVMSNDDYSDIFYSVAVDGVPLEGNQENGNFYWIAQEGTHTIVATVTDTYNNSVETATFLKVELPPPPSIEKITWYPSNPIGGNNVDFEVEATSLIGISDLIMKVDSEPLSVSKSKSAYTAKWMSVPGQHILRISAKDARGTISSTQTSITVGAYPFPKIKSFTWTPQNPSLSDKCVVFKVIGEDPNGFYANVSVDGKDLDTTQPSEDTYVATWDTLIGYHMVNVKLEDSKGWYAQETHYISILPPQSDLNVQIGITPKSPKHGDEVTVKIPRLVLVPQMTFSAYDKFALSLCI